MMRRLLAVFMEHPDPDNLSSGPGVLLPDGRYIFAHNRGISVYSSEEAALRENPGATIHRAPDADETVNP